MATARYSWGIDIGNRALKAIRLTRTATGVKIDDYDVIEHEQILSNAGDNREALIAASLSAFAAKHNLKSSTVAAGVSGQSSFARFIKLPPVERKQIPNIVRFEAIQQIPFPLEDVEWSYQLFETPDSPDVEVGIFAMRKELVARHIQHFVDVDMKISVVQMNPLAVYNAMQFDGRLKEPTMIIDMGAENTDLIIADNDSVWLRSISIGGNSFTEALVKAFKLNFQKAEELKRTAGTSKYTRQIFQAMRPVFGDLVSEIQRSMGFFSSVRRETRIKRIIALGGTFRLPNLLRYLQQNLQLDVERMDSFRSGAPADAKQAAGFNENLLSLAGAYGLALQGMGDGKIQSSLLPEAIRRERMWKEKTKWFGAAAALMLAGTGIAYGSIYLTKAAGSDAELKQRNDQTLSQAQGLATQWDSVASAGAEDRDLITKLYEMTDYREMWANLIRDVRGALPQAQEKVRVGLATWDADAVKSVPRGERELVLIGDMTSRFVTDLNPMLKDSDFRKYANPSAVPGTSAGPMGMGGPPMGMGFGPMGMGGPDMGMGMPDASAAGGGGTPAKGYLITARVVTPYSEGAKLVQDGFVANLLKIQFPQDKNRRYIVAKAQIVTAMQLGSDTTRLQEAQTTYNVLRGNLQGVPQMQMGGYGMPDGGYGGPPPGYGGPPPGYGGPPSGYGGPPPGYGGPPAGFMPPGMPGGYPGGMPGSGQEGRPEVQYLDPLTEEDITKDWEFVVLFAVAVDPPADLLPAPAPAQGEEETAAPTE